MGKACRTRFRTVRSENPPTDPESRVRWQVTYPAEICVDSREPAFRRPRFRADCTKPPAALPISAFPDASDIPRALESTRSTTRAVPGVHREDVGGITPPEEGPIFS